MSQKQNKQMIEPAHLEPSISRQCQLLGISRSSFYYVPRPMDSEDLELMRLASPAFPSGCPNNGVHRNFI